MSSVTLVIVIIIILDLALIAFNYVYFNTALMIIWLIQAIIWTIIAHFSYQTDKDLDEIFHHYE